MMSKIFRICCGGCCSKSMLKGCRGGGWGAVLEYVVDGEVVATKLLSGALPQTTNNRAELQAVIFALAALKRKGLEVKLITDSQYVAGQLAGNKTNTNHDLVQAMRKLAQSHTLTVTVVKGHSGHAGNETCDTLAQTAARAYASSVHVAASKIGLHV